MFKLIFHIIHSKNPILHLSPGTNVHWNKYFWEKKNKNLSLHRIYCYFYISFHSNPFSKWGAYSTKLILWPKLLWPSVWKTADSIMSLNSWDWSQWCCFLASHAEMVFIFWGPQSTGRILISRSVTSRGRTVPYDGKSQERPLKRPASLQRGGRLQRAMMSQAGKLRQMCSKHRTGTRLQTRLVRQRERQTWRSLFMTHGPCEHQPLTAARFSLVNRGWE